ARMAERGVPQIMGQRHGFGEVLIKTQGAGNRARDLAHFQRMGEPGAEMMAFMMQEHLRLVLESPERRRMDDAVAIALEFTAGRAFRGLLNAPARPRRVGCIGWPLITHVGEPLFIGVLRYYVQP